MSDLSIEVIIPVRNMAEHLQECVTPLIRQCADSDTVTVVDDASSDDTACIAGALGARVLRLETSHGPYRARQAAASRSQADILLFVDGRCRPLDGLLQSHRVLQSQPGVRLSCTNTKTLGGSSLAARVSARRQLFNLQHYVGKPGQRNYYPTCNLGIDRAAFTTVGGFRAMRSGADADICWRIQDEFPDSLAADPATMMEWMPRSSLKDLAEQSYRYGRSYAYLQWVFDRPSVENSPVESVADRDDADRRRATTNPITIRTIPEVVASAGFSLAFQVGYFLARRKQSDFEPPQHFPDLAPPN